MSEKIKQTAEKLDVKKTLLIGFGFMASSIAWIIYDPYVTKLLKRLLMANDTVTGWSEQLATGSSSDWLTRFMESQGEDVSTFTIVPLLIGIIMTFDNMFGVIFQPAFGKLSDRCRSKWGKRRPFIFIGAPIAAVLFSLIPLMNTVPSIMIIIILFVFVMSLWRSPVVALMPDLTPTKLRSEGNAIINLCGGVAGAFGMILGQIFVVIIKAVQGVDEVPDLTEAPLVFGTGAVFMIIATIVLRYKVHEEDSRLPAHTNETKQDEKEKLNLKALPKEARVSLIFMLVSLFFIFSGANAIQTFFALFADEILHKTTSQATMMMLVFAIASMGAAVPAGICGKKFGRKKTILSGMFTFISIFIVYVISQNFFSDISQNPLIWVALVVAGAANMFITVNTLPLVLEIGGLNKVGTFTGYYYTATFSAQIASPIVYGIVRMLTGTYMSLFWYCPIMFAIALLAIFFVRHGEADQDALEEQVKQLELDNAD